MLIVFHNGKKKMGARRIWAILFMLVAFLPLTGSTTHSGDRIRILALGDSLTAGYGLKKQDTFPVRLEATLNAQGHAVRVNNAGVSGNTTAGGLARLSWALANKPQMVILELGANDGLRGLNPSDTKANLNAILRRLKHQKIAVLLTGMLAPPNLGKEYGQEFNRIYGDLAKLHGIPLYAFFLEGVANQPHLNQKDGIHPNPEGVDVIVTGILPKVTALIENLNSIKGNP